MEMELSPRSEMILVAAPISISKLCYPSAPIIIQAVAAVPP